MSAYDPRPRRDLLLAILLALVIGAFTVAQEVRYELLSPELVLDRWHGVVMALP